MRKTLANWKWTSKWVTQTLILAIFPVILFGAILYEMGSGIVQKEIQRSSQESLKQIIDQMDTTIRNVEQAASQTALQTTIIDVMNIAAAPPIGTTLLANQAVDSLSLLKVSSDSIESVYMYHFAQNVVLTNNTVTSLGEKRVLSDDGWLEDVRSMARDKKQRMWLTPRSVSAPGDRSGKTLSYLLLLPYFASEPKAALIVNMNAAFLNRVITRFPLESDGKLLVFNESGVLLAQTSDKPFASETMERVRGALQAHPPAAGSLTTRTNGLYVTIADSSFNHWRFALVVPANVPRQSVNLFKWIVVTITLMLCALALVSAFFSHSRFQKRIRRILEKLSPAKGDKPPAGLDESLSDLETQIAGMLQDITAERIKRNEHLPLLRAHYLYAAVLGNTVDLSRWNEPGEEARIFPYDRFCVLVAELDPGQSAGQFYNDPQLFLFAVSNIAGELAGRFRQAPLVAEALIASQHAVVILNAPDQPQAQADTLQYAELLRTMVKKLLKMSITIGIGSPVDKVEQLALSYREAVRVLQMYGMKPQDAVLSFQDVALVSERLIHYPSSIEQDLIAHLRARSMSLARDDLTRFREEIERSGTTPDVANTFYLQLLVAIVRLIQEFADDVRKGFMGENPYETFFRLETLAHVQEWMATNVVEAVCRFLETIKRSKTGTIIRRTLQLIEARYQQDLSLQMAADAVGISPAQLSLLFKEEVGETFIEYVTNMRIRHAVRLLVETDMTLAQITDEIGYTSVQQLFRVFKKSFGMTPGEYREQHARS